LRARALQTNGGDQAAALAVAKAYYAQAVQNRLTTVSDTVSFAITDNATAVVTTGNAAISTPFMGLGGTKKLPLLRADGADYAKAVLAVGGNAELNLEVSMMLDITGSMGESTKLADMKSAATDLINIVVWNDQSKYTSKVAIVPFAYDVRLPTAAFTTAVGTAPGSYPCVVERTGAQKYTDAAPGPGQYVMAHNTSSTSKNGKTTIYSRTCDLPSTAEVLRLTSDKNALTAEINGLATAGSTAGHIGTAWAWYMLSPDWSSLWSSSSSPQAYNAPNLKKIAVLMTDGEYNTQYKSDGVDDGAISLTYCPNAANGCSSDQAVAQCTATGDALKAAFRDIALNISTIYLSQ
jgi:hypothetical protein